MSLMSGKTTEKNPRSDRNGKKKQNKRDENAGSKKSKYEALTYDCGEFIDGILLQTLQEPLMISPLRPWSWKEKRRLLCVCSPIEKEVDRKAAAKSVGEKTVDMIHVKDLTKITGYIRGGCSPLGMKKIIRWCLTVCRKTLMRSM